MSILRIGQPSPEDSACRSPVRGLRCLVPGRVRRRCCSVSRGHRADQQAMEAADGLGLVGDAPVCWRMHRWNVWNGPKVIGSGCPNADRSRRLFHWCRAPFLGPCWSVVGQWIMTRNRCQNWQPIGNSLGRARNPLNRKQPSALHTEGVPGSIPGARTISIPQQNSGFTQQFVRFPTNPFSTRDSPTQSKAAGNSGKAVSNGQQRAT